MAVAKRDAELREAFQLLDRDGDGLMRVSELRVCLVSLGVRCTEGEFKGVLREVRIKFPRPCMNGLIYGRQFIANGRLFRASVFVAFIVIRADTLRPFLSLFSVILLCSSS